MNQSALSRQIKMLLIATGICGLLVYAVIMPNCLQEMFPLSQTARLVWMVFLLLALIPCYAVLGYGWKIADRIGSDRSFSRENASALKHIARLALIDTAYVFVAQTVFLFVGLSRATIAMFALVLVFVGIAITFAATALAHLVDKAAILQEENDATV